jgi:hypothetical protein
METKNSKYDIDAIGWGVLFVWWGFTEWVHFLPAGSGLIGMGLILLSLNAIKTFTGVRPDGFSITIGILVLVWGLLKLAEVSLSLPYELPVFAILLIGLGLIVLFREVKRRNGYEQRA